MFYLIFPGQDHTTPTARELLRWIKFSKFCFWFSVVKQGWNFVQRIHKKKETQFETIEFKEREGKVASLLCTQNMELSIIFLFDLLFYRNVFLLSMFARPDVGGAKLASFYTGTFLSTNITVTSSVAWL